MKNNIIIPISANPKIFMRELENNLTSNLTDGLIKGLSNMLAIDYVNRVKDIMAIDEYSIICASRLKKHLKHEIIVDQDFSTVMSLFAIAITKEKNLDDDTINSKAQEEDLVIDAIVSAHFSDLSPEEIKNVKQVLRILISSPDSKEIMNFISSDPKLFYSIVFTAYKEKIKEKEVIQSVTAHLNTIMAKTNAVNKYIDNVKSLAGKMALGVGLFGAASVGLVIGGLALPTLLIPAVAVAIRVAPAIGEKAGEVMEKSKMFQEKQADLKEFVQSVLTPNLVISKGQAQYLDQKKQVSLHKRIEIKQDISEVTRLANSKKLAQKVMRER